MQIACAHLLRAQWRRLLVVLAPLVLAPLLFTAPEKESRCAYVVLLMSVFWMTEAVPLPVTSLLPVALFPLLGVLGTEEVCVSYLKETNMMFIGGLIVAAAVERCSLHKRIALKVTLIFGTSPVRILLGLMATTMALSMWITNTATTAMMIPIVQAVIEELKAHRAKEPSGPAVSLSIIPAPAPAPATTERQEPGCAHVQGTRPPANEEADMQVAVCRPDNEAICYYLGVAYASNLGGVGTLTGTGTNLIFKGLYEGLFPRATGLNFATWMLFNVPLMLVNVGAACLWLQFLYMGLFRKKTKEQIQNTEHSESVGRMMRQKYKELGPMTFQETSVLVLFTVLICLWFFREPEFIPGWAEFLSTAKIKDATPVMLVVFVLFVLPANPSSLINRSHGKGPGESLLNWKLIHDKVPWGLVLLLGGGFAMATACKASGLSRLIGQKLATLNFLPPLVILMVVCTATQFITEVASNTATANIVLPVLAEMATAMRLHPLYLMMPAVLCCSYAFMLPVATPPNALVLAASNMRTTDMMRAGIGLNVICLTILFIMFPLLGSYIYNLDEFPAYAVLNLNGTAH